jgi:hypothetical protein
MVEINVILENEKIMNRKKRRISDTFKIFFLLS